MKYSADMVEYISVIMDLQWHQDKKVDDQLTRYGITDDDSGKQREMLYQLAKYDHICRHDRRARIKVINIQRGIRQKDGYQVKFDAPRRGRCIDATKCRREYFIWIISQRLKCEDQVADFQEYGRGRQPMYDFPISGREGDEETTKEYYGLQMQYTGEG